MICSICREKEATQKHHIQYDPEITIDICVDCHKWIHKNEHGVGNPRIPKTLKKELKTASAPKYKSNYVTKIIEERIYDTGIEQIPILRGKNNLLELLIQKCPHCKKNQWLILKDPSSDKQYLYCPACGYDRRLKI